MEGNFSLSFTLPMDAEPQYDEKRDEIHDEIYDDFGSSTYFEQTVRVIFNVINSFICVVCIFGLVGNGIVIWLLGFRMKRNPFTTYILNLAVADFGVLTFSVSLVVLDIVDIHLSATSPLPYLFVMMGVLFHCAYSTSQFLLTTISIDRCVAVLFPLWYRCHRPEKLSTVLCVLVWLLSFLVQGSCVAAFYITRAIRESFTTVLPNFYAFLVNAMVCLPLIMVSTLILFIRFCFKSQQRQRGKLLTVILLTLFFFLIFAFPLNVIYLIYYNMIVFDFDLFLRLKYDIIIECGWLCASLNSFVNPLLYFLIGRKKRGLCRENLKLILQRVFIEEEEEKARREEPETQL